MVTRVVTANVNKDIHVVWIIKTGIVNSIITEEVYMYLPSLPRCHFLVCFRVRWDGMWVVVTLTVDFQQQLYHSR